MAALLPLIREAGGAASTLRAICLEHRRFGRRCAPGVSLVASNTAAVQQQAVLECARTPILVCTPPGDGTYGEAAALR